MSRAPYGARGLKCRDTFRPQQCGCRAPYGARGLKYLDQPPADFDASVAPHTGRVD